MTKAATTELYEKAGITAEDNAITLGKSSRAVLEVVIASDDFVTARTAATQTETAIGPVRAILRTLREKGLIVLAEPRSVSDRVYRYKASDDADSRVKAGDKLRAARRAMHPKTSGSVDPMNPAIYAPLALKVAAIDRTIVRWTGTSYRERKELREKGKDPEDKSEWTVHELVIDGETVSLRADEVGPHLRALRKGIVTLRFKAAQRLADLLLLVRADGIVDEEEGEE